MELITPTHWTEYELIDSGDREKLERFGKYILIRPEPQAVWPKALPEQEWERRHHARYRRAKGKNPESADMERGTWSVKPGMPEQWNIRYGYKTMNLVFRLGLTAFGHIGVFPEQAVNWEFIYERIVKEKGNRQQAIGNRQQAIGNRQQAIGDNPVPDANCLMPDSYSQGRDHFKVLNLFAYTGGASLAARAAGAEVTHVDSVRPVITWAREMMEASGLDNIRWVVEDAMNFVKREVKRGNRYHGIILDPPAYGRGPDGEKWVLSDSINELISLTSKLLLPENPLFILSLYSMGFSSLIGENLVQSHFRVGPAMQSGELYLQDQHHRRLPLGTFLRF